MANYPTLQRDPSFWGMTATQFLGAFNDNVFKMLVLLICADYVKAKQLENSPYFDPYQTAASFLFALAFVLFSGVAGYFADRYSKKSIIVSSKVAEGGIMLLGMLVFLIGTPGSSTFIFVLFAVLFLMGLQSAYFGPSKYGVLPEIFSDSDLPKINGVIVGTTFLAIIFGTALTGILKQSLGDQLWWINLLCVGLAVAGTGTSLLIRRPEPAQPKLRFSLVNWFGEPAVWRRVIQDRMLLRVLVVYSVFWFVGGVITLTITLVGKVQLGLDDNTAALFNAAMGLGIGSGCVCAAKLSGADVKMWLVRYGSLGLFLGIAGASLLAVVAIPQATKSWLIGGSLFLGGFFGGWVAIPLQVFIQARPEPEFKGRVVAIMNVMTWIGIALASVYYFAALAVTGFQMDPSWIMLTSGLIMLLASVVLPLKSVEHLKQEHGDADA